MPHCGPVVPPKFQTQRQCFDGVWNEKVQRLWFCVSRDHECAWLEWRDTGGWTADPRKIANTVEASPEAESEPGEAPELPREKDAPGETKRRRG